MKRCIECNKKFELKHFNEKFCSKECRLIGAKKVKSNSRMRCKEHARISTRNWYLKNKKRKLQQNKIWRENNRERMIKLQKRWKADLRLKMLSILGDSCKVCGSKQTIQFHEIHGIKHMVNIMYVRDHIANFVPLCGKCHRAKTRLLELSEEQRTKLGSI